ncbi:hypothetical protein Ancab_026827 [Ancistrocladus abbreviatus]
MGRPRSAAAAGEPSLPPLHNPSTTITNPGAAANASTSMTRRRQWPTIDGPLGLSEEESLIYARRFYKFGFLLLPWLWAVNCFYFWPVLRNSRSFPAIHRYIARSAIGFTVFSTLLSSWALTFTVGGESLFGPIWDKLVTYNVADELGLSGWM